MHVLLLGAAADRAQAAAQHTQDRRGLVVLDAATLPFNRVRDVALPHGPRAIVIDAIERAFPNNQIGGTRLVLTQSTYLMQTWIDALDRDDRIVATADRDALERGAPEALQRGGPWRRFEIVSAASRGSGLGASCHTETPPASPERQAPSPFGNAASPEPPAPSPVAALLAAAYASRDPAERIRACREACERAADSAAAWLALASAYREHRDLRAREALERAATLAPDWEAVHFETGKLWLALDDLPRARDAFARAADLMPTFTAALSNLGAARGELNDPDGALAAFRQALDADPDDPTLLSNAGVVARELGRLDESAAALRQVVALAPDFVFGHYNLGHTLFLAGSYEDAIAAYEEGARRDPRKTPRQACRLAMSRFAAGDAARAERELWAAVDRAPADERDDLLLEAYEIAHALLTAHPALSAQRTLVERLAAEIDKSE